MYILGIDPGSLKTGWAIIHKTGRQLKYVQSGVIKVNDKIEFINRLKIFKYAINELIEKYPVDVVAMESLIFVKSPTALIKLAQTRGVILGELVEKFDGKIFEYAPNVIKRNTVGHGHADKDSIQKFMQILFGDIHFATSDESDALAIAVCHAMNNVTLRPAVRKNTKGLGAAVAHKILEGKL